MAITDYNTLIAEVKAWAARSDTTFSARMGVFVALAEDRMYNGHGQPGDVLYSPPIRARVLETTATVTLTDAAGTLPDGILQVRRVTRASDQIGLLYAPPQVFQAAKSAQASGGSGVPYYYTIEGVTISVTPTWDGDLVVAYLQRPATISADNPTGTLLTAHPLAYFNAMMFEAFSFMQEPDLAMAWLGRYRAVVDGINRVAQDTRTAGRIRTIARAIG